MTQAALVEILAAVEELGVPENASRANIRAARDDRVHRRGDYGPLLKELDLYTTRAGAYEPALDIVSLVAFLDAAFRECPAFRAFLMASHAARPSSPDHPWGLVLYGDEVVPGAQIAHRNERAFWVIYASFMEFGAITLTSEHAWMTLSHIRSRDVRDVVSGISQVFGALLKDMFCGPIDPHRAGIHLTWPADGAGTHMRLFWELRAFVMDGGAAIERGADIDDGVITIDHVFDHR